MMLKSAAYFVTILMRIMKTHLNKIILVLAIVVISSIPCYTEVNYYDYVTVSSARQLSMGSAFVAIADDSSSIPFNPAGIGFMKENEFAVTLPSSSYNMDDVGLYNASAVLANPWGNFGFFLEQVDLDLFFAPPIGHVSYRGQRFTLTYSYKLNKNVSLGINLNEDLQSSYGLPEGLTADKANTVDLGALIKLNDSLSLGMVLESAAAGYMVTSTDDHELAQKYFRLGLAYRLIPALTIAVDGRRFIDNKYDNSDLCSGFEFKLTPFLTVRAGTSWVEGWNAKYTMTSSYGLGYQYNNICLDYAHLNQLGNDDAKYTIRVSF